MIRGMLIDFDGTLVDTHPFLYEVYHQFLADYGVVGSHEEFDTLVGPPLKEVVASLKKKHQLNPDLEELYLKYLKALQQGGGVVREGVREFLKMARDTGIKLAVVTSGPRNWVEKLLKEHGIESYFEFVVSGNDTPRGKPFPDPYLQGIEQLGLASDEIVAVEDSPQGFNSAEEAGLKTYFADWQEIRTLILEENHPLVIESSDFRIEEIKAPPLTHEERNLVEERWNKLLVKTPGLFNGQIFNCSHQEENVLYGYFIDYKTFMSRHYLSSREWFALAVTGYTTFGDEVLWGKRSNSVSQYKNTWETVPSGSFDQNDPVGVIYIELAEEVGITKDHVQEVVFKGAFKNLQEKLLELLYEVKLKEKVGSTSDEVAQVAWLKRGELPPEKVLSFAYRASQFLN